MDGVLDFQHPAEWDVRDPVWLSGREEVVWLAEQK